MADTPHPIQATTLDETTCRRWIAQLLEGRQGAGTRARFSALHEAIKERDLAFHRDPAVAPKFAAPFDKMQTYQSDVLRQLHAEAMIRLTEHPIRVHVQPPRDTIPQRDAAEALAVVFEQGLELVQEATQTSILGMLGDGQVRHAYGVLHWYKRSEVYPSYPDPDELDELPSDAGEANQYRAYGSEEAPKRAGAKYRETEAAVRQRDLRNRVAAGFPYAIEVPRPDQFGFVADKGAKNGMGIGITMESIGVLDYDLGARRDGYQLSLYDKRPELHIYQEQTRPERGEPSADDAAWGQRMKVARLWTRDECYELGACDDGEWQLLRSWQHDYGMPPFALAYALRLNEPDPLYAYQPFLAGLYRTKPDYDYERSLGRILAELTAIPRWWIELAEGAFMTAADGSRLVLTEDALSAFQLPPGAKLVRAELHVDPAFVSFLQMSQEDVNAAKPDTGQVEVGASTAPHTLNMAQAQANVGIAYLKAQQVLAVRTMLRNIAEKESKSGESLVVMAKVQRGKLQAGTIVEVKPQQIPGLDIDVTINPNSGAQQIAVAEYYRGQLNDPKVPFGPREYLEKIGEENPDAIIESDIAQRAEFAALDRVVQQELARRFGDTFVLVPGGGVINFQGQQTSPEQVLASQGVQPAPPTVGGAPAGAPGVAPGNRPLPATLPPLQPLAGAGVNGQGGTL